MEIPRISQLFYRTGSPSSSPSPRPSPSHLHPRHDRYTSLTELSPGPPQPSGPYPTPVPARRSLPLKLSQQPRERTRNGPHQHIPVYTYGENYTSRPTLAVWGGREALALSNRHPSSQQHLHALSTPTWTVSGREADESAITSSQATGSPCGHGHRASYIQRMCPPVQHRALPIQAQPRILEHEPQSLAPSLHARDRRGEALR